MAKNARNHAQSQRTVVIIIQVAQLVAVGIMGVLLLLKLFGLWQQ